MTIFRLFRGRSRSEKRHQLSVRSFGFSHIGKFRTSNQDAFLFNDLPDSSTTVLAVADGMGGHQGGEVASSQAIKIFGETLKDGFQGGWRWPLAWGKNPSNKDRGLESCILERSLMTAHFAIKKLSLQDESLHDMGTTFTAALIEGNLLSFVHVGDSRLYLLRDGELSQLTDDHRFDPAVSDTLLNPSGLPEHYTAANVLTKCVGDDTLVPDFGAHRLEPDDVLLLCSDGLTDMISDEHIRRILITPCGSVKVKVQALLDAALNQGGRDNVTVVVGTCHKPKDQEAL